MVYTAWDAAGNAGVVLILGAYVGLQAGRLDGRGLTYSLVNAAGAGLVLVSLVADFNLSAFVVEGAWVLISLLGAARALRQRRAERP